MSKSLATRFKKSHRWSPVEARSALAALASSGLSVAAFARREGLDPQRLRAWRQRLEATESPIAAPTFVEVTPRAVEPLEVVLPSGVVLRVPERVDVGALRRIVMALDDGTPC